MKTVLQSQAAECGLACLAMIADHHGNHIGLHELRRQFPLSLKGATLTRLIGISHEIGLQARAVRIELDDLRDLRTPCVLHWDLSHFVVLVKASTSRFTIIDPAFGRRTLHRSEMSKHFTGVALELTPAACFAQRAAPPAIKLSQLTGTMRGLWRSLGLILLLSVSLQVFVLLAPFYLQWVVDQALVSADRNMLAVLGLGFGLALLLQVAIGTLRGWIVAYVSSTLNLQWAGNVFAHALRLPLTFFETRHFGDVVSRMGAVQAMQRTLTTSFVEAFIDGLMAIAAVVMMVVYSVKLAVLSLLAVALYVLMRGLAFRTFRAATEQQLVASAKQQSHLLESLRGIQSIKVAGQETYRQAGYQNLLTDTVNQDVRLARLSLGFSSANQLIFGIERIAVVWIGALLAMNGHFSVGMLIAYLAYKELFAMRIGGFIDKCVELRMLRLHGERLAEIVLEPAEDVLQRATDAAMPRSTSIEVEGLSFRYADDEPWILRNCSFSVEMGESVAITGVSGCGKTTLVKLMLGLLPPTEGTVRLGGRDIRSMGLGNFRALTGAVMQDDQLFAGSVLENIAFGEMTIDLERVESCARMAAVHEEIVAMPMGYHSLIGDIGSTLSGGQKQRVILARALYRQPKVLFLDEATSHLDVERERNVNDAVRALKLTRVIIAHRPETIASVDRVLALRAGSVVEVPRPVQARSAAEADHHTVAA